MRCERRVRRSDSQGIALTFQLQTCAERAGVEALLLSDEDGLLVAGSPCAREEADEVAAVLPYLARGGQFAGILLDEGSVGRAVQVRSFRNGAAELFVCALGKTGAGVSLEISRAIAGIQRILA